MTEREGDELEYWSKILEDQQLAENFHLHEFRCQGLHCCGHSVAIHPGLIATLQNFRTLVGQPFNVLSGFRCNRHNLDVGGSPTSFHPRGMAVDIQTPNGLTVYGFFDRAQEFPWLGGIGIYDWGLHLDIGPRRTWDKRTKKGAEEPAPEPNSN